MAATAAVLIAVFLGWPRETARNVSPPATPPHQRTVLLPPVSAMRRLRTGPDYDSIARDADPHDVAAGRVPGMSVVDSAELGTLGGVRAVALLVHSGGPSDRRPLQLVYLASGAGARRTIRSASLSGFGGWPGGRLTFGAMDVDGDGVREPYLVGYDNGTEGYGIGLSVMRPDGRGQYVYLYDGIWGDLRSRRGRFQEGLPVPGPTTRRRMRRLAEEVADSLDAGAHHPEVIRMLAEEARWVAEHGRGYHDGPMHPRWERGGRSRLLRDHCQARDGTLSWIAPFRGNVVAVDPARGRHFIVYVPESRRGGAAGIVVGRRYVWLGQTARVGTGYGLLAYDKPHERLVAVPIPELAARDRICRGTAVCGGPWLSLRGGRIHGNDTLLTLPDSIDPRVEFAGATWCSQ